MPAPEEDVPAQDRTIGELWKLTDLLWPHAVRTAIGLRLADLLAPGPRTGTELAKLTSSHPRTLDRLLRYLVTRGVFTHDAGTGTYALNGPAELLRSDHPSRLCLRLAPYGLRERSEQVASRIADVVRTGEPSYPLIYGRTCWADLDDDPALSAELDALGAAYSAARSIDLIMDRPWADVCHVADIGGGTGTLLARLLAAHPHLHGTLVDRPGTAAAAAETLAAAGVGDRAEVVASSFFDPLPPGADLYIVAGVLHDWDDDAVVRILRRCAEAGGRTLLLEWHPTNEQDFALYDVLALALLGGRLRAPAELADLARQAGLAPTAAHRSDTGAVIVECG